MDTGLRLQRYVIQEVGEITNIKPLQGGTVATLVALASCLALAFGAGTGGMLIRPLFGTTNQLLAGLLSKSNLYWHFLPRNCLSLHG